MNFLLLGPVQATHAGRPIRIGVRKQRFVLAMLCLQVNNPVGLGHLQDALWPEDPPATARAMIHTYISRLRAALDHAGVPADEAWVDRSPAGYALRCDPMRIDVHRFHKLLADAQAARADDPRLNILEQALALWQGPALAGDVAGEARERLCAALEEARLQALEDLFEVRLRLGRDGAPSEELIEHTTRHPQRPRLTGTLMLARHRAGQSAEALQLYDRFRRQLIEDHGLDPPRALQDLQAAILRDDPDLQAAILRDDPDPHGRSATAEPARTVPVPRQLPAGPATFTGRTVEIARLLADADDIGVPYGAPIVVIDAIDGMAGVGKTTLAIHAAHRLAGRFPDGQLFIDLHGFTQGMAPVAPEEALDRMLRGLGVSGDQIPESLDARAALYRTVLAERRLLIVLDNAVSEAQVEPLIPGAPGCLVLITGRHRLVGMAATRSMSLDVMHAEEAVDLFTRISRSDPADQASRDIVELCGGLPLAIRIAAARLRSRPAWTAADLAPRLRDHRDRLGELEAGQASVTASIDLSYNQLDLAERRLYRLLGLHPGPDIDMYAAAALSRLEVDEARRLLDGLVDVHLLQEPTPGRYRFHDLLRAHAARAADRDEPEIERDAARIRLLDHYVDAAATATELVYPFEAARRPQVPTPATPVPPMSTVPAATGWLEAELGNLLAAAEHAAEHDRPFHVLRLSAVVHRHLFIGAHYARATRLHTMALAFADAHGVPADQARTRCDLGAICWMRGRYQEATDRLRAALNIGEPGQAPIALAGLGHVHLFQGQYEPAAKYYDEALAHSHTAGIPLAAAEAHWGIGQVHRMRGQYGDAAREFHQAVEVAGEIGYRFGELQGLYGIGQIHRLLGEHDKASACYRQALQIARATGDKVGECTALRGIGHANLMQGHLDQAAASFERSLAVADAIGHHFGQLYALRGLGDALHLRGDHTAAARAYRQSKAIAEAIGDHTGRLRAYYGLGRIHHATGDPRQALSHHQTALNLADQVASPDDQARALDGLAHANHRLGNHELARQQWRRVLDILTTLGIDRLDDIDATRIRATLEELDRKADRPQARD